MRGVCQRRDTLSLEGTHLAGTLLMEEAPKKPTKKRNIKIPGTLVAKATPKAVAVKQTPEMMYTSLRPSSSELGPQTRGPAAKPILCNATGQLNDRARLQRRDDGPPIETDSSLLDGDGTRK